MTEPQTLPEAATVRTWTLHLINEGTATRYGARFAHEVRDRNTGDVLGRIRQDRTPGRLWEAEDHTGARRVTDAADKLAAVRELLAVIAHGPECTGCVHDCPWKRTNPAPLGAPFCGTCDDHAEAAAAGYGDDPETDGGHFLADPTGGGTWHAGAEPADQDDDDEPDAMRCDIFGHEPGPAGTCGACGAPLAELRQAASLAVDLAEAAHRTACERVGRLAAELDAARADVRRFREERAAAVEVYASTFPRQD